MGNSFSWTGAAPIAYKIKETGLLKKSWLLRWKPVCASTEIELSKWLKSRPWSIDNPRAFLAERQSYGKGQRGRKWKSPRGGIWLSAALPCEGFKESAGLFGLAVAVALAKRLENSLVPVKIKWPNDLLVNQRKIAGLLPRVVYRGRDPTFMCLGIGLNVCNRVPKEGISLSEIFGQEKISIASWSLEVLLSIEKAASLLSDPVSICDQGERMLWAKHIKRSDTGEIWEVEGLDLDGRLKVSRGTIRESWNRWE